MESVNRNITGFVQINVSQRGWIVVEGSLSAMKLKGGEKTGKTFCVRFMANLACVRIC